MSHLIGSYQEPGWTAVKAALRFAVAAWAKAFRAAGDFSAQCVRLHSDDRPDHAAGCAARLGVCSAVRRGQHRHLLRSDDLVRYRASNSARWPAPAAVTRSAWRDGGGGARHSAALRTARGMDLWFRRIGLGGRRGVEFVTTRHWPLTPLSRCPTTLVPRFFRATGSPVAVDLIGATSSGNVCMRRCRGTRLLRAEDLAARRECEGVTSRSRRSLPAATERVLSGPIIRISLQCSRA